MTAEKIIEVLTEHTAKESVIMNFVKGETDILSSKLGGVPFIPAGGEYPVNTVTGRKLFPLIQINFAEVPRLEGYPNEGIMQIFIYGDEDCLYGEDFDEPQTQAGWRLVFHEDISKPMPAAEIKALMPEIDSDVCLPFAEEGAEYGIRFTKQKKQPLSTADYRFDRFYEERIRPMLPDEYRNVVWWELPADVIDKVEEAADGFSGRIGGYPGFCQSDPRYDNSEIEKYELLLQIDSDSDADDEWVLMWGDAGVANFFISTEDLKNRDFSRVYYTWDCY